MKKIISHVKEEEFFLREVDEEELKELQNGGVCLFIFRCPGLAMIQPFCPKKKCNCYNLA